MPSIQFLINLICITILESFKPYYNWNAFNTKILELRWTYPYRVLNLIITGMPSIRQKDVSYVGIMDEF